MFPTVSHFIHYLTGLNIPLPFQTFGLFVAMAFAAAYWAFSKELKRKEALGILHPWHKTETIGEQPKAVDLILSGFFGFLVGYKLVYAAINYKLLVEDTQSVLISLKGNIFGGIALAALFVYWEYNEKKKAALPTPKKVTVLVHPYQLMSHIVVWAAIWGFLGAKIFDNLEHWETFIQNPLANLFALDGLTFYGGLICGGAAVLYIAHKNGIKVLHMLDVGGPGMMLAYSVGRIGCHMAGDGDWGIVNLHPKPWNWLPDWLWAYTYPNNVARAGEAMANCVDKYCRELPQPVYPTPLYEVVMAFILFLILWNIRKRINIPGMMFGIYLVMNGLERFFIELIRVNTKYPPIFGISFTQAELISSILFVAGLILIGYSLKNKDKLANY